MLALLLLALIVSAVVGALRSPASQPAIRRADGVGRATQGADAPIAKPKAGVAEKGKLPKPVRLSRPTELHLTKAHSAVFDVRRLKGKVVKRERPEDGAPGLVGQEGAETNLEARAALPTSVGPGTIAASPANAPAPGPDSSFDGLDFANWGAGHPPDENGDVGPAYYIQTVNSSIGIYAKSTGSRVAAFTFNAFMSQGSFGNLCDTNNFGDPVVLYDSFEDRWFITDFAFKLDGSGNVNPQTVFQCFAVSKTGDPVTGGWNFYSILAPGGLDDYPKFGVWPDGIYMSANMFGYGASSSFISPHVWAINKAQMYAGAASPEVVDFAAPSNDFTLLPANARLQVGTPPAGEPEFFVSTEQLLNALSIYKFHVDWDKVSTSTFIGPLTQTAPTCWPNATPPNAVTPANAADVLPIRAMAQTQYTNIGGSESLWVDHTVNRGEFSIASCGGTNTNSATVRWYQANVTGGTVAANVAQGATFDPEGANTFSRYVPSLAVDRVGDMAVGYTKSNATTNPQIKYAGRLAGDPANTLGQTEQTLINGTGAQNGNCGSSACIRWGDYSGMALDPNGCEFWMTGEYYATNGLNDLTRIGSFHYPSCTTVGNGTLSGTATDGANPISGATVALGSRTTTTDGSGNYSFAVPAGTYASLSASKVGFDPATASTISVPNGGTATRNFTLNASSQNGCFTDNSQSTFQRGVPANCDLNANPGSIVLASPDNTAAQNSNVTPAGFGFSSTAWAGQTFTPTVSGQLKRVDVELFCASCTANTPNVTMSIRNTIGATPVPTGADLGTATLPGFNDGGAGGLKTFTFATPVSVTAGTRYAFIFRLSSSFVGGTAAYTCSCVTTGFSNSSPYANGQRVSSTNSGSTWTADTTVGGRDLNFITYVNPGFASSGTFVSSLKDANPAAGRTSTWTTLSFADSAPSGTAVRFQVAGSNNQYGPFNFIGPDGTSGSFFTTSGADLSQFNGFRYLRYKAYLSTSNSSVTPALNSAAVCFSDVVTNTVATSLAVDPATGSYGGTTQLSATLTAGGNGVSDKVVDFTLNGNSVGSATTTGSGVATLSDVGLAGIGVGSYPGAVQASFAGDSGYDSSSGSSSLTVSKADQTINFPAISGFAWLSGSATLNAAAGSGLAVDYSVLSGPCGLSGNVLTASHAGSCVVAADQAGNSNYNAAPQATRTAAVTKADQTITIGTPPPATATYGTSFDVAATAPGGAVTFSNGGGCSNAGATFTMTSGTGTCTVKYDQGGNGDYNAAPQVTKSVTAQKADQTITVTKHAPSTAAYNSSFDVAATAPGGAVTFSSGGACSNSAATFTMTGGTGTCTVEFDQGGNGNYNAAPQATESVTADKASLTITANDRSKLAGQALDLGTTAFTTSGLVSGDGVASVTLASAGTAAGATAGTYPIVSSDAVAGAGTDLDNYSIIYENGTLTVSQPGIVGLDNISVGNRGALVDSFDSTAGTYSSSNMGNAASLVSNGSVTLAGAKVHGDVRSAQGSVTLKSGSLVTGDVTGGTTVTNAGTINGALTPNSPTAPLAPAPVTACSPYTGNSGIGGKYTLNAGTGDLTVKGKNTATLAAGTYCFHNVTLSTGAVLRVTGPVTLRLTGTLNVGGGSNLVNSTLVAANLQIRSSFAGLNGVSLSGVSTYMTLYAPRTGITLASASAVFGALLGRTLTASGDSAMHFDIGGAAASLAKPASVSARLTASSRSIVSRLLSALGLGHWGTMFRNG